MDAVFNTKAHIYYRPAGINEEYVYRIPGNFIDEVEKEQEWGLC